MVRRIYEAQKTDPSQGDFVELVKQDFENIKLNMSEKYQEFLNKDLEIL